MVARRHAILSQPAPISKLLLLLTGHTDPPLSAHGHVYACLQACIMILHRISLWTIVFYLDNDTRPPSPLSLLQAISESGADCPTALSHCSPLMTTGQLLPGESVVGLLVGEDGGRELRDHLPHSQADQCVQDNPPELLPFLHILKKTQVHSQRRTCML